MHNGIPRRRGKIERDGKIFEKIMVKKFLNLGKKAIIYTFIDLNKLNLNQDTL